MPCPSLRRMRNFTIYAIHGVKIKQRRELVSVIRRKASQSKYKDAYHNVIEEVASIWFNRLIAIRFMKVNDYLHSGIGLSWM